MGLPESNIVAKIFSEFKSIYGAFTRINRENSVEIPCGRELFLGADRGGFAKASAKLSRKLAGRRVSRCGDAVDVCSALAAPQARSDRRSRISCYVGPGKRSFTHRS